MLVQNLSDSGWSNKFVWQVLPDGCWSGRHCFIIGGGTSLETFDWSLLKGHLTIGVNRAFEVFEPTVIFTMDRGKFLRWVLNGRYGEEARKRFIETKAIKVVQCTSRCTLPKDIYVVKAWRGFANAFNAFPFTTKDGIGHGSNSGYGALNLAVCFGANPIYLLGFDMYYDGAKTHWHDGHLKRQPPNALPKFMKFLSVAASKLKGKGIEVINLNPHSNLDCFKKADPDTVLSGARLYIPENKMTEPLYRIKVPDVAETVKNRNPTKTRINNIPFRRKVRVSDFVKMKEPAKDIYVTGPYGFGDTFYLRPLLKHLSEKYRYIYVRTTLPEAFWDLPSVRFVRPSPNRLKHQREHIEFIDSSNDYGWTSPPKAADHRFWAQIVPSWKIHMGVAVPSKAGHEVGTAKYIEIENGIKDFDFSFPLKDEWIRQAKKMVNSLKIRDRKICIVRQPAVNKVWPCYSRNPKLEYFQMLIDKYKNDYYFISIGSNKKGYESYTGRLKGINKRFDNGELSLTTIFALIKLSDMVITFPAFFMVVAIALRAKCFCIFGGCTRPDIILNENMGLENFSFSAPNPFCNCMQMNHDCNREIPSKEIFKKFRALKMKKQPSVSKQKEDGKEVSVGLPPGIGDMHWVLTKLESFKEKNRINKLKIVINQGPGHEYSTEFLKLIPFVDSIEASKQHLPFTFSIAGGVGVPLYRNKGGCDYIIEFNSQLENHTKLRDILPEYEVNFDYPINIPDRDIEFAKSIKNKAGGKLYLLYTSSIGANKNWARGSWRPADWIHLIERIYKYSRRKVVIIGAKWDSDYIIKLLFLDKNKRILSLVGETSVSQALALIKNASIFIGFLSGLPIMATKYRVPTVTFWPLKGKIPHGHLNNEFKRTWLSPEAEKAGYFPFDYGDECTTPNGIFNAIRKYL